MTDGERGIDARLASSLASQVAPWNPTGGAGRIGFCSPLGNRPGAALPVKTPRNSAF